MRILHVSPMGLPDSRIEKVARHFWKKGHYTMFLGGRDVGDDTYNGIFHYVESLEKIGGVVKLLLSRDMKRKWREKVLSLNPDLIHVHDIFPLAAINDLDIPIVYDDHEFWSMHCKEQAYGLDKGGKLKGLIRRAMFPAFVFYIKRLERAVLSKHPTVTTNMRVVNEHMKRDFVWLDYVINAPAMWQVRHIRFGGERHGVVYAGGDVDKGVVIPHRDMTGLRDYVNYYSVTGLSHRDMMQKLTEFKFGIVGWKYHPVLDYKNQNKTYEYLHAGLQLIIPEQLAWQFSEQPFIHVFEHYKEIPDIIANAPDIDPMEIVKFARDVYVWEDSAAVYERAYYDVVYGK